MDKVLDVQKVVGNLPSRLAPSTFYAVRVGGGYDLYLSDSTGATAHRLNNPAVLSDVERRMLVLEYQAGIRPPPANLLDLAVWERGNINAQGNNQALLDFNRTKDFIPIPTGNYTLSNTVNAARMMVFYDKNRRFIRYDWSVGTADKVLTVGDDVAYFRFAYRANPSVTPPPTIEFGFNQT